MSNKSNYHPINEELIVHVDKPLQGFVKQDNGDYKKGMLIYPYEQIEGAAFKESTGVLVEVGENCFPDLKLKPSIGDRLVFKPYAGTNIYGDDDEFYRILSWKEIRAIHKTT